MMTSSNLGNRKDCLFLSIELISVAKCKITIINESIEPFIISVSSANNLIKSLLDDIEEIASMLTIGSLKLTLRRIFSYTKNLMANATKLLFSFSLRDFNAILIKNLISHSEIEHKVLYGCIVNIHLVKYIHNVIRKIKLSHFHSSFL